MRYKYFVAALSFALAAPAVAQAPVTPALGRLVGRVVEAETGAPLPASRVELVQPHRTEFTHEDGVFTFTAVPAGTYTLAVGRVGYTTTTREVTVRAGQTTELQVDLSVRVVALDALVVTGTTGARSEREVFSPTSAVSGAELDRRLGSTVGATLERTPGVSVASIGPATARPVIRGLGGDRVLVLEDGARPGDLSASSPDHAVAVEPLTARRIEVVRGPMSLLYGSSALGGVVNVVRDEVPSALPEDMHGAASAQLSSVNRGAATGGYVTGKAGRIALRGEASARSAGDVRTPGDVLPNTDTRTFNASAGAAYVDDERGHVGAAYRVYDSEYGIPGGFVGGHPNGVDIRMRRQTVRAEGIFHPAARPFATLRTNANFTDYQHEELESDGNVGTRFDQQLLAGELFAQHEQWGPLLQGAFGVRGQWREVHTGGSLRTPATRDVTLAGYAVEEWVRGPLRLQAGARYDWTRVEPLEPGVIDVGGQQIPVAPRRFGAWSGSLGALYTWTDGVQTGASVSRAFRTPDFNELYSNGPHLAANSFDVGDPNLDAERGIGADVFARIDHGGVRAEVAAYLNQLNGYIFPSSRGQVILSRQGGRPLFRYTNEDARFWGWEADLEWEATPRLVLDATASQVLAAFTSERAPIPLVEIRFDRIDTTFVDASPYPPFIPPLNGRVGARYARDRWFAGGGAQWAMEQERTGDFEQPTAGYALADAFAGLRLLRGGQLHSVTLQVENLLDTEYRNHLSRIKDIMPQPGRNVSLLYRLSF